jgi:hypothetical protein
VIDDKTGWTFEPGNADDLAKKMRLLIGSKAKRQKLGSEGRKVIAQYSFADQAGKLLEAYAEPGDQPSRAYPALVLIAGKNSSRPFVEGIRLFTQEYSELPVAFAYSSWLADSGFGNVIMTCCTDVVDDPATAGIDGFDPVLIPAMSHAQFEEICRLEGAFPYQSAKDLAGLLAFCTRAAVRKGGKI